MNRAASLGVAALLFALAGAEAASTAVSGTLSTPAAVRLSPSSTGEALLHAAFWPNASGMRTLSIEAARLHVDVFEFENLDAVVVQQYVADRSRSLDVAGARVGLEGAPTRGWVGYYGDASPVDLSMATTTLQATTATLGNTMDAASGGPKAPVSFYSYVPDAPYILAQGPADLDRAGPVSLKLFGPSIRVTGEGFDAVYWTGSRDSETTPGAKTVRWIVLSSDEATLRVASDLDAQLAMARADLRVSGEISAKQASGALDAASGSYVASGGDAVVLGDLRAAVRTAGSEARPTLEATLSGDLASTTLGFARAPAPPLSSASPWLLGVAGVVGLAVAAVVARQAYLHKRPGLTPEQLTDLAYAAADAERFQEALEWIQKARELAPSSERLRMDEASFLAQLGHPREALALYDGTAATSATGEADYHAAVLMIELGMPFKDVRARLLRALGRTPYLALEIMDDAMFEEARRDPQVARAITLALRKLDSQPDRG